MVRRFTILLGVMVTAAGLLVSATPLYGVIVERLHGHPGRCGRMGAPDPHHPGLLVRPNRVAPQLPGSPDSRQPDGDYHHRYRGAAGRAGDRPLRRAGTLARTGCGGRRRCHGHQRCRRGSYGHVCGSPGAWGQTGRGGRPEVRGPSHAESALALLRPPACDEPDPPEHTPGPECRHCRGRPCAHLAGGVARGMGPGDSDRRSW